MIIRPDGHVYPSRYTEKKVKMIGCERSDSCSTCANKACAMPRASLIISKSGMSYLYEERGIPQSEEVVAGDVVEIIYSKSDERIRRLCEA
jgi:hypothetical protein